MAPALVLLITMLGVVVWLLVVWGGLAALYAVTKMVGGICSTPRDSTTRGLWTIGPRTRTPPAARAAADAFSSADRPRWVLGSMGPGTKLATLGHAVTLFEAAARIGAVRGVVHHAAPHAPGHSLPRAARAR